MKREDLDERDRLVRKQNLGIGLLLVGVFPMCVASLLRDLLPASEVVTYSLAVVVLMGGIVSVVGSLLWLQVITHPRFLKYAKESQSRDTSDSKPPT